jgi:GT2 family glycosyltransferase
MKKLLILIPTINQTELLTKCVNSITTKHDYDVLIINNWDDDKHIEYCMTLEAQGIEVQYYPETAGGTAPPHPSVAASWNTGLLRVDRGEYEYVIIPNDDIEFKKDSIDLLVDYADQHSEAGMVFSNFGWSCFLMTKYCIDNVGYFDENFYGAYLEDVDYFHRKEMAGVKHETIYETDLNHKGSATIGSDTIFATLNDISHGANFDYMKIKWGLDRETVREAPKYKHPDNVKEYGVKDWILHKERYWAIRNQRASKRIEMLREAAHD